MSEFTLTAVAPDPKLWTGDHGEFAIYDVEFEGAQGRGTAQLKQKSSTPPPTPGMKLDAEIVQRGGRPAELKRIFKQNGTGGGKSYGRSPAERSEMRRMSAQKQALTLFALELQHGSVRIEDVQGKRASDLLTPRIEFFDRDAKCDE